MPKETPEIHFKWKGMPRVFRVSCKGRNSATGLRDAIASLVSVVATVVRRDGLCAQPGGQDGLLVFCLFFLKYNFNVEAKMKGSLVEF